MSMDWQKAWPESSKAAKLGDMPRLLKCLDIGEEDERESIDTCNERGASLLQLAALYGHIDVVNMLLERGADLDHRRPSDGQTAYHQACYWNKFDCAEALVKAAFARGNTLMFFLRAKNGKTGREMAAGRKFKPLVKMLDVLGVPKKAPKEHKQDKTLDWDEGGADKYCDANGVDARGGVVPEATGKSSATNTDDGTTMVDAALGTMPLPDQIAAGSSIYLHKLLNEPSLGLYFIQRHIRRTSPVLKGTSNEFVDAKLACKQRCLDVDDMTPVVDEITSMPHIRNLKAILDRLNSLGVAKE